MCRVFGIPKNLGALPKDMENKKHDNIVNRKITIRRNDGRKWAKKWSITEVESSLCKQTEHVNLKEKHCTIE